MWDLFRLEVLHVWEGGCNLARETNNKIPSPSPPIFHARSALLKKRDDLINISWFSYPLENIRLSLASFSLLCNVSCKHNFCTRTFSLLCNVSCKHNFFTRTVFSVFVMWIVNITSALARFLCCVMCLVNITFSLALFYLLCNVSCEHYFCTRTVFSVM